MKSFSTVSSEHGEQADYEETFAERSSKSCALEIALNSLALCYVVVSPPASTDRGNVPDHAVEFHQKQTLLSSQFVDGSERQLVLQGTCEICQCKSSRR